MKNEKLSKRNSDVLKTTSFVISTERRNLPEGKNIKRDFRRFV